MKNEETKINPPKKMNFFKRIYISIFKVENYGEFVIEKTSVAVEYFLKLMLLISIVIALATTVQTHIIVTKGINYLKNEMPDFKLNNGIISFEEDTEGYDKDFDFYVFYSTKSEFSDSIVNDIKKDVQKYTSALIYLQDRVIYYNGKDYAVFKYIDLQSEYNLNISNRYDLVDLIDKIGITGIDLAYFGASFLSGYIINAITIAFDVILVLCFGILASRLCGVNMPFSKMLSLSIYSLTLSILLSSIYTAVYTFTNFYIEYFQIMYILIAYIYLIAAILIIKSDVIKQKMELQKIIEVQKQVKKELEEQKEEPKEDNKKDGDKKDKEDNKKEEEDDPILNREPDGSEI